MKQSEGESRVRKASPVRGSGQRRIAPVWKSAEESKGGSDFAAVFETSSEALAVISPEGLLKQANPRASEMLFTSDAYQNPQHFDSYFQKPASPALLSKLARSRAREEARQTEAFLKTGNPIRVTLRSILPDTGDLLLSLEKENRSAGEGEDGNRKVELSRQGAEKASAKMLQTEKMAALGQLVSGIAHELNNPLTGIMGYAQLLLGQNLPPAQRAEAAKVFEEAARARDLVKNLLCFARENKPERTRVQLNEIVERTLALRSYELKVENIEVKCDLPADWPETMADANQLRQVVLNLLVNAEQALIESRGRGQIELRTGRVSPDRIALEVLDYGPGIPQHLIRRVFDPFFTTKAPGVGTGLGLSIVYGIIQQHEGEVSVENWPEGGARFRVEIPVRAVTAATPGPASASSGPAPRIAGGRVMVVEDEPTVAQLIADVLKEEGHTVEAVLDSQEGLTRLSRTAFDPVICNLNMPRVDGPAFFEALVRSGSPLQHSMLFITGDTLAARTQEFLEGRRLPYLAKPFLVEELKLSVNQLLEARGKAEGASLDEAVGSLPAASHIVFLASNPWQAEAAPYVAHGTMDFVQKSGEFFRLVTALIERNLQGCTPVERLPLPYGIESSDDLSAIFRHEINNPLTGILGNAELLLAHRHQLPPSETQRLQTIVELAVRLRETIRRLSSEWEAGVHTAHIQ